MPGRRRKQQILPSGLLSHKYSAARGRQGRAPMYTNEHYVYAQCGGPPGGEGGRAACQLPHSHGSCACQATHCGGCPAGWETWPARARAYTPHTAALPVRALSEGRAGHSCPSIPCHLYPEPQSRPHFLLNMFLFSEGRQRRGASTLASISWAPRAAAGVSQ